MSLACYDYSDDIRSLSRIIYIGEFGFLSPRQPSRQTRASETDQCFVKISLLIDFCGCIELTSQQAGPGIDFTY